MIVRRAEIGDLSTIYTMGFDAWGENRSKDRYLEECQSSSKYGKGEWSVLVVEEELVSSLITYEGEFELPHGCYGIGSVATAASRRRHGYASYLVKTVLESLGDAQARGVYLFSDIGARFYERLGFQPIRAKQPYADCLCMVHPFRDAETLLSSLPSHF